MGSGIPVTVLSGGLGAGKTTTLNRLLHESGDRSIAVLVNDMGDINVDAELLASGTDLAADGRVAELSNGCICCELQTDLETEVARLASEQTFDYLVVESSGISEPEPVARLFTTASRAAAAYDLDTMVTVVDASQFVEAFGDSPRLERTAAPGDEERPLSDLLVEQLEFADVVLLNKRDLVDESALDRAETLITALAPRVEIIRTEHGCVDPDDILGTGRFDPVETGSGAGWRQAIDHGDESHAHGGHTHDHDHDHDHIHPESEYGITSFTYRRRRPFDPDELLEQLRTLPSSVVRAKGPFWAAGRDETAFLLSLAGPTVQIEVLGPWLAGLPDIEREMYRNSRPDVSWHDEHGDRRTELVFIGRDIDADALTSQLDACLVADTAQDGTDRQRVLPADDDTLVVDDTHTSGRAGR
ncbi:CobW domain protein [Natronomonas pharaonis DSM 2160]|uniref:CobW domain protein n=1 Tax=Natronomonas pharaonis (strain ATCC 35678 / DSM 2160 / CIP 103997 / JCM 8858 / NBRC 14720 / NCIMB 2260 / Gabara) TaxID=348780 RepID=A0A1U7EVH4_NATPD|nr:GTP-binding protein [Natronomonas pharaonis]CAI49002.1 CobW domain protein [Natronomonas pharaonis DSM 2160]